MKIGILLIGDELLTGEMNPYPLEMLNLIHEKRTKVAMVAVVGDEEGDIMHSLENAERMGVDILVVTGGLGPTLDDITRGVVAKFLGTELEVDSQAAAWMEEFIARKHGARPTIDENLLRMAKVPQGAKKLRNLTGAAVGIEAKKGSMTFFCLPGFPSEMMPMFKEYILPRIEDGSNYEREIRVWRGESSMEPLFQEVVRNFDVHVASLPDLNWRERGNRVVIKGDKEEVERAFAFFQELLERSEQGP